MTRSHGEIGRCAFVLLGLDYCDRSVPPHWQPLAPVLLATGLLWLNPAVHCILPASLKTLTLEELQGTQGHSTATEGGLRRSSPPPQLTRVASKSSLVSAHQWLMVTVHHRLWMPRVEDCSFPEQRNKDGGRIALGLSLRTSCHSVCGWRVLDLCLHSGFSLLATTTCSQWLQDLSHWQFPSPHSCCKHQRWILPLCPSPAQQLYPFSEQPGAQTPFCLRVSSEGGCLCSP